MTPRQANVGLALLAGSGAFVSTFAIESALKIQRAHIQASINALLNKFAEENKQCAFVISKHTLGFALIGTGDRLDGFFRECLAALGEEAGLVAQNAAIGQRLAAFSASKQSQNRASL